MRQAIIISLFFLFGLTKVQGQIVQDFNQSVNQIGSCWQNWNMEITTKNTINSSNQKKALIGKSPGGNPAYSFTSPLIYFDGTGNFSFRHKLNANNGTDRSMVVYLLDSNERVVQTLHSYTYLAGGVAVNGNPTNVVNVSLPVTWTGTYILHWEFSGSGGSSLAMVDDILIDGTDQSDGTNDNGYGYCRADDVVYDTVCAGTTVLHTVPYTIDNPWNWQWIGAAGGTIDSSFIAGSHDTTISIAWNNNASGDFVLEATETHPPYNTTTYNVTFNIHVLPFSNVTLNIDSVCPGESHNLQFTFSGSGPWNIEFTDGDSAYTQTYSSANASFNLPAYNTNTAITVTRLTGANGCALPAALLPSAVAAFYTALPSGPIYNY